MATAPKKRSAAFVTVACKLPSGLHIHLHDDKRTVVKLHGTHSPYALMGHGMTDIPAEQWAAIEEKYAESAWLKNEVVFAMSEKESAVDKAEDRQGERAGFEPIDPNKLPGAIQAAE